MNLLESVEQTLGTALGRNSAAWPPSHLSLALQGGGSFGAFTWGVLDRLLESGDVDIDTVSGTSAGAVNAVLLADGPRSGWSRWRAGEAHTFLGAAEPQCRLRALRIDGAFRARRRGRHLLGLGAAPLTLSIQPRST